MNQRKILLSLRDRVERMERHYRLSATHLQQGQKEAEYIMREINSLEGINPSEILKRRPELSDEENARVTADMFKRRRIPVKQQ